MAANDEVIRLLLDMGVSKENVQQVVTKLDELKTSTIKAADGLDKVKTSAGNSGQSLLQTGRVIQDFAQGGLGGILNNIEGLTIALGLGSGLAGILTVLGVVALTAGPSIKSFFSTLVDGSNKVPDSVNKVAKLTDAIRDNAKELEALKDKHVLTNTELARYNELTTKQVKLEKEVTEARKQRKKEEDFDAQRPAAEKRENAQAEAMKGMVGTPVGRQQEMVEEAGAAMLANKYKAWESEFNAMPGRDKMTREQLDRHTALTSSMSRYQRGDLKGSEDATAKAELAKATAGDPDALKRLMGALPEGSTTREILRLASPDELAAQHRAGREADADRAKGEAQKRVEKERHALDRRTEDDIKASDKAEEEHAKAAKKDQDNVAADVQRRHKEGMKKVEDTDIDERAASRAGALKAQGGVFDRYGRFRKMNDQQQEAYNQRATEREIAQRFKGIPQNERQALATQTTQQAGGQVNDQVQQATVSAMHAGLNAVQATQQAMNATLQGLRQAEQRANELKRNARMMGGMTKMNQQTAANLGGPW